MNFKAITVLSQDFCDALNFIEQKGFTFIYDVWHQNDEMVTLVYALPNDLLRYNLSKLSKRELQQLCRKDGIAIKGEVTVVKLATKADVLHFIYWTKKDATPEQIKRWEEVEQRVESYSDDYFGETSWLSPEDSKNCIKWRKSQFKELGIPYTKQAIEQGMLSKEVLINKLINQGGKSLDWYSHNICG